MNKIFSKVSVSLAAVFLLMMFIGETELAKASPNVRVTERELKRNRNESSDGIYERAHRIIWGSHFSDGRDDRPRIAVVINGDENIIVENRVKNEIYKQLRAKFPKENFALMKGTDINTKLLQIAEDKETDPAVIRQGGKRSSKNKNVGFGILGYHSIFNNWDDNVLSRAGGHGGYYGSYEGKTEDYMDKEDKADADNMRVLPNQPRGIVDLKRRDYVNAGRACNYDYVFVITFTNGNGKSVGHDWILFNTYTHTQNVWMRMRFVDTRSGDYLYRNDIVAQGETGGGGWPRLVQRSVGNAMKEAMRDISVEY